MKYLLSVLLLILLSGCSVAVIDMAEQPTQQKFDLTDGDGDGVINARDLCMESFPGAAISNAGCDPDRVRKLRHKLLINFDHNSYQVKPEFYSEIKTLADFMSEHPTTKVTIEGHTSKLGSKAHNMQLSQNRAQAVKDILITRFSIAAARVTARGYGFEKLLSEANDPAAHARNRRIVAEISTEKVIKNMKWNIYSVDQPAE